MIFKIIDLTHIKLIADAEEEYLYSNHSRILIDNVDTFVSSTSPSAASYIIERPNNGSLFNVELDISNSPFTTEELLFAYLELADGTFPFVFPIYDNYKLLNTVAELSGVFLVQKNTDKFIKNALPILAYYSFKLALSVNDLTTAIRYWKILNNSCNWGPIVGNPCSSSIFDRCNENFEQFKTHSNCCGCHEH